MRYHKEIRLTAIGIATMLVAAGSGYSQPKPPKLIVAPNALPQNLYVTKGTTVQFVGDVAKNSNPVTISLRQAFSVLAESFSDKHWELTWDTANERASSASLSLWVKSLTGQEARWARIEVVLWDKMPFTVVPLPSGPVGAAVPVQIASPDSVPVDKYEVVIDGKATGSTFDAKGRGEVAITGFRPGQHLLSVLVHITHGNAVSTENVPFEVSARVEVLPLDKGNTVDMSGPFIPSSIPVHVKVDPTLSGKSLTLFVDDKSAGNSDHPPFADAAFDPGNLKSGAHTLRVEIAAAAGNTYSSGNLTFQVARTIASVPSSSLSSTVNSPSIADEIKSGLQRRLSQLKLDRDGLRPEQSAAREQMNRKIADVQKQLDDLVRQQSQPPSRDTDGIISGHVQQRKDWMVEWVTALEKEEGKVRTTGESENIVAANALSAVLLKHDIPAWLPRDEQSKLREGLAHLSTVWTLQSKILGVVIQHIHAIIPFMNYDLPTNFEDYGQLPPGPLPPDVRKVLARLESQHRVLYSQLEAEQTSAFEAINAVASKYGWKYYPTHHY